MSIKSNLKHVIREMLIEINELETEEELINMITSTLVERSTVTDLFGQRNLIAYEVSPEKDTSEKVEKGIFVYTYNSLVDWTFEQFDSIAEAIKNAVKKINAYIIYNGEVITYDALDENTAYYYLNDTMKLVTL